MLQIRKLSTKTWRHVDTIDGAFILTKFYAKEEFNEFLIVESYGAKRRKYLINEIEVYDIGGTAETFANFNDLFLRLEALKYTGFYQDGDIDLAWGSITGTLSYQTDLQNALDSKVNKVTTAGVERVYTINTDGSQGTKATSNFKDVLEFTNLGAFPATGETSKIYIDLSTNLQYRWSGSVYVQVGGGTYNPSFWLCDKLTKTSTNYFVTANLLGGNTFGGSSPNPASFKTMLGFGIMSGTNANGGARVKIEPGNAIRPTPGLSFYSCFNLANTTRDNIIKIGFFNTLENITPVTDGFWLQINGVNATLNTANGGVNSQSSSSPLTTTYMECLLEYVSSTQVKCKIKELLTGNVVFNQTLTTNIPTTAKTFGCGLMATITTAGASNTICSIQELSFGIKPEFLNDF